MKKSFLISILLILYIGIILFTITGTVIYANLFAQNTNDYSIISENHAKFYGFKPDSKESLAEADEYLKANYTDYEGYISNTGMISSEVSMDNTSVSSPAFLLDELYAPFFSSKLESGAMFTYNNSDEIIPVIVGGEFYKDVPLNTVINVLMHSELSGGSDITIPAVIVGKIDTPSIMPEFRDVDFMDIFNQMNSLIIIPDYYSDLIIEEPDSEVWLCFNDNTYYNAEIYDNIKGRRITEFFSDYNLLQTFLNTRNFNKNYRVDRLNGFFVITLTAVSVICFFLFKAKPIKNKIIILLSLIIALLILYFDIVLILKNIYNFYTIKYLFGKTIGYLLIVIADLFAVALVSCYKKKNKLIFKTETNYKDIYLYLQVFYLIYIFAILISTSTIYSDGVHIISINQLMFNSNDLMNRSLEAIKMSFYAIKLSNVSILIINCINLVFLNCCISNQQKVNKIGMKEIIKYFLFIVVLSIILFIYLHAYIYFYSIILLACILIINAFPIIKKRLKKV